MEALAAVSEVCLVLLKNVDMGIGQGEAVIVKRSASLVLILKMLLKLSGFPGSWSSRGEDFVRLV